MNGRTLKRVVVKHAHLEIPEADFEGLPAELGCTLRREGHELTLSAAGENCLYFELAEEVATLSSVHVNADPDAAFLRDVLGLLAQVYGGDVAAELEWSPTGWERLEIVGGDTSHPLLFTGTESDADEVDRLLAEAQRWWTEYRRLKGTPGEEHDRN